MTDNADTAAVRWRDLVPGNTIICPVSALPEKVTSVKRYNKDRWFVRTTRHDHIRPLNERVTMQHKDGRGVESH